MKQKKENASAAALSPKSKKIIIAATAIVVAIAIILGITLPILLRVKETAFFKIPESTLPIEET